MISEKLSSIAPGRPPSYTDDDVARVLAMANAQERVNVSAIASATGLNRKTVRRIMEMEAQKEKAAPREGNGQASSKEEDAGQSIPAATGSASPAEGGKI